MKSALQANQPAGKEPDEDDGRWADAQLAAMLFALDPHAMGGVCVHAHPGPVLDTWLAFVASLLPGAEQGLRRVPVTISEERLLGGLDLAATLSRGQPVAQAGVLAELDAAVMLLAGAERLAPASAAIICEVMDSSTIVTERDGIGSRSVSRFGIVAIDESVAEDEQPPPALVDRMALLIDLREVARWHALPSPLLSADLVHERADLAEISVDDEVLHALCASAFALGIDSLRAPLLALACARAAAALAGRAAVGASDVQVAARLVLAPRATRLPAAQAGQDDAPPQPPQDSPAPAEPAPTEPSATEQAVEDDTQQAGHDRSLDEVVIEAAQAAIPAGLLARLQAAGQRRERAQSAGGRAGQLQRSRARGRPAGVLRGAPGRGNRLSLIETLRAAAPWQPLRAAQAGRGAGRVQVRRDDFRITRFKQRSESTIIFAVDASGSQALHRLAETKGAVERLLAECYVRRDRVALVVFRGQGAQVVLPPTRSLVLAKRRLAGLPGGGATPLASGIDIATQLALAEMRGGATPIVVLMTDGRGNVSRDGAPGRAAAAEDALEAARRLQRAGVRALLIDTSARPRPAAADVAQAMGALCLPLPQADSSVLFEAVRASAR